MELFPSSGLERPGRVGSFWNHPGGKVLPSHGRLVLLLSQSCADGSNPASTDPTDRTPRPPVSRDPACFHPAFLPSLHGTPVPNLKPLQKAQSSHRTSFFLPQQGCWSSSPSISWLPFLTQLPSYDNSAETCLNPATSLHNCLEM